MNDLKKRIKSSFVVDLLVSYLHCLQCKVIPVLVPDEKAVKKSFRKAMHYELNLDSPKSFSEKMNWYKLRIRDPLMQQCADKVEVREFVRSKGYGDTLNIQYGVYNNGSEVNIDELPERFVLKASHGSHMNVIVKDKDAINWHQQKMLMNSWVKQDWGWSGREWVYKGMKRRIIAEKYLEDESGELRDYKFFCFNGVPKFVQVELGRFGNANRRNYYDMEWNLMPFERANVPSDRSINLLMPENFEVMIEMAKNLSEPFQFVRVDLYNVRGKVYFGELTFFNAGGFFATNPPEWDRKIGDYWTLEE